MRFAYKKAQEPGGGGTSILGQYGYVPRESPPPPTSPNPYFWPWHLLKTLFFRPVQLEKILLFKIYTFRCYFELQTPFFTCGPVKKKKTKKKKTFSVRGRSLSHLFLNSPWHICTTFIFEYPPRAQEAAKRNAAHHKRHYDYKYLISGQPWPRTKRWSAWKTEVGSDCLHYRSAAKHIPMYEVKQDCAKKTRMLHDSS